MTISKCKIPLKRFKITSSFYFLFAVFMQMGQNLEEIIYFFKNTTKWQSNEKTGRYRNAILFLLPVDMIDFSSITVSVGVQKTDSISSLKQCLIFMVSCLKFILFPNKCAQCTFLCSHVKWGHVSIQCTDLISVVISFWSHVYWHQVYIYGKTVKYIVL